VTWDTLEDLEAAVVAYQTNWWLNNDDALNVANDRSAHPDLRAKLRATSSLGQMVTTTHVYRPQPAGAPDDRPYLLVRRPIHERIMDGCVAGAGPAPDGAGAPSVFFTIGCPGAGKSSVLRDIVDRYRNQNSGPTGPGPVSIIDADRVRQLLPEYAAGLGAFVVEEECYYLTYGETFDRAVARGADIVYDTIGRLNSIRENLDLLHERGFEVHVLHATCSLDLCRRRTEQRALNVDGRLVSSGMLERAAADAQETLAALLSEGFPLAGWAVVDTMDMAVPTLLDGTEKWSELL
jgi:hypothetical protein